MKRLIIIAVIIIVVVFIFSQSSEDITNENVASGEGRASGEVKENGGYKPVTTDFDFTVPILEEWQVVSTSKSLNFYDSLAEGETSLDKSQIFVTYFNANDFQTLTTVNILSREEHEVVGRPAVTYLIRKKDGVKDFANQPSWRNVTHKITNIRLSDSNPSTFYVFAKKPDLSEAEFQKFLNALEF